MICQADLWQWIASNLRHITMLESSAFQRPGYARTDLCIQNTAIVRGQALPTVDRMGLFNALWIWGVSWESTPTRRPAQALLRATHTFPENALAGMPSVTRRKTSREMSANGRI
jgi:hypothetical protein